MIDEHKTTSAYIAFINYLGKHEFDDLFGESDLGISWDCETRSMIAMTG